MPKISITLILFAVLCLLAVNVWRRRNGSALVIPFLSTALLLATQALLVSLRWDFGFTQFRIPHVLLAAAMPSITWMTFRKATTGETFLKAANMIHVIPLALVALSLLVLPDAIDFVLVATFVIYGSLFLMLATSGESSFSRITVDGIFDMRRAVWLLAFTMLGSAVIDVIVFLDFLRLGGEHAALVIGLGNLTWLLALGISIALGSGSLPASEDEPQDDPQTTAQPEDHQIAARIKGLLTVNQVAMDPGLTLSRLARRAGLPIRSVSNAINRVHGLNVSQFVNDIRIAHACKLLTESRMSVTEAIYASGFQTKSNFNREFRRVTGKTPREFKLAKGDVSQSLSPPAPANPTDRDHQSPPAAEQ